MTAHHRLSEIAVKPAFRTIDGVSIRFAESEARDSDALLLSPWPESVLAYEPTWPRLAETTHLDLKDVVLVNRDVIRFLGAREADGVELRNCPPYIRAWITQEAKQA